MPKTSFEQTCADYRIAREKGIASRLNDVYTDEAMPLSFVSMPRGAFTGFQMIFLFLLSLLPEAESECRVCQPAS